VSTVTPQDRHTKRSRCIICDGAVGDKRGKAERCTGFTLEGWTRCSREEFAGSLNADAIGLFHHRIGGVCPCGATHAPGASQPDELVTYDYKNELGALIFQVVRKPPKKFIQRRPDGAGGWIWDLKDVKRIPYRLPELLAADPERMVYVVEGEKDVETLRRLGHVATTNPGGKLKWEHVEDVARKALAGRNVTIIGDRDEDGGGIKHALDVRERLHVFARSVVVMTAPTPHKDVSDVIDAGGSLLDLVEVDLGDEVYEPQTGTVKKPALKIVGADLRPEVFCTVKVHEVSDALGAALATDPELYKRTGALCHVLRADDKDEIPGVAVGSPIVRVVPLSWLVNRVSRLVRCVRRGKKNTVAVAPPKDCVRAVLEQGEWPGVRNLRGVIEAPAMRPDGSIIQEPGYDAATGYLYEPNAAFLPVADEPTHSDAVLAYARLAEPFAEFPYVSGAHRSAVIAAILTLLARPAIRGAVPVWVFDASSRRSGKSLQVDIVHIVVTGRSASRMTFPEQDEELEKVLSSYAMRGAATVNFDNVARKFGGAALDKVATAVDQVDLRVLGSTDIRTVAWLAVIFASGNNVTFGGDMAARVLSPRIETALDNPETFSPTIKSLRSWTLERRAVLVHAALTILRAYVVAGRPDAGCPLWGGFEEWASLVPHALRWVGADDPMGARRGLDGDVDPDEMAHAGLVDGWSRLCDSAGKPEGLTVKQAIAHLYPPDREHGPPDGHDDLREVVEALTSAKAGFAPSTKALGDRIRRWKGKPVSGRKLVADPGARGTLRWRVTLIR
jgi:hypothetical protein